MSLREKKENTHRVVKLPLLALQMQVIRPTLPKWGQRLPFAACLCHPAPTEITLPLLICGCFQHKSPSYALF